ncbi:hypothetical protein BD560DRAFT_493245 [Blakeslea trispora]|nr:hypothetical protein BD560DRAFT_493245 [Blakeslea trispora]
MKGIHFRRFKLKDTLIVYVCAFLFLYGVQKNVKDPEKATDGFIANNLPADTCIPQERITQEKQNTLISEAYIQPKILELHYRNINNMHMRHSWHCWFVTPTI